MLTNRSSRLWLAFIMTSAVLATSSCFVSLDESLIQQGPASDASLDVETGAGDAKSEADTNNPDTDNDVIITPDADADAEPDSPEDVIDEADVSPEADAPVDVTEASDVETDGDNDAAEGGDPFDGALRECYDDTWCPPVGCKKRKCSQGVCTIASEMKEDITSFELPGNLACNQATNRVCVVGVRNYLAALTADGFVIFNTRNPGAVRLETVPNNICAGYSYLIRSGERLWAVKNSAMDTTEIAWLDLPLDGRSPVSPPSKATVRVPYLSSRLAAPNDAIYLYHYSSGGNTARYAPGLPTNLPSYFANDAQETGAAASSGPRLLLFSVVVDYNPSPIITYQFSLQSDPASPQSANSGTYELPAMINSFISSGYFASSRSGAVAWVLARRDEANDWKDLRAYWLVANQTAPLDHVSTILETYTTQPTVTQGQVAFINDDTIAITVMSGTSAPSPMLDIVQRKTGNPSLLKRIPLSPIAPGNFNVAGDAGYAYVVTGTTVRMFAPSCKP